MKKLIIIILILAMFLPEAASAGTHVDNVYTLYIDAYMYNRTYGSNFDFDSMIFDLIITTDGRTAYYCKQTWKNGIRTTTDMMECKITSNSDTFLLTFPTGEEMDGYYDPEGNGVWMNLGGKTYFRFVTIPSYDITKDYHKE